MEDCVQVGHEAGADVVGGAKGQLVVVGRGQPAGKISQDPWQRAQLGDGGLREGIFHV